MRGGGAEAINEWGSAIIRCRGYLSIFFSFGYYPIVFFVLFFFSFSLKQPQNQTSENLFVGCKFLVSSNLAAAPLDSNNSFWQCFPIAINM